ncbi:hypothetical protein C5167_041276 [Papaver somniferum]|uniref:AAA+ ATPase domain-containing protein n=1 Tax=Papaver somniferum TaxID=3469 RepID=A0A4Y7ILJ6_PAPSO|nr:putative disease resistance protein At1g50180 [Papaver somniferum]RZC48339.1 hypothetical protein C5167_041276 [Papaver somniferum]
MAEGAVLQVLLETVKNLIINEVSLMIGVEGQIVKLQDMLDWMHLSIIEADEAFISDKKLKLWVMKMREIMFDTEDAIDGFILEIVHPRRFQKDPGALTAVIKNVLLPLIKPISLREYGRRIENINTRVQNLKDNKENFWFDTSANTTGGCAESSNQLSQSPSLQQKITERRAAIAAEEIGDTIHIHEDSVRQVKSLLTGDECDDKRLRVISIIGMGGVGKTTLSRNIYKLMHQFDRRAFVYISKSYKPQEVLRSIVKCFPSISCEGELTNKTLHDFLKEKKYLIVLDDVWDITAWDGLKSSFPEDKNGSRVLLTTRHEDVANTASSHTTNIHRLSVINKDESWRLFLKKMFPSEDTNTSEQVIDSKNLVPLGKEMVRKCYGLPLAIVVLGSLLLTRQRTVNEWRKVNDAVNRHLSQVDGDPSLICSGILALSYDYLPYYLKPCFLYMSLFPEGTKIRATKLFQYWIAEGFVRKEEQETLEDIAENHLEELIRRSLIQVSKLRCDGRVKTCRIHNLLRDISITESKGGQFSKTYDSIDKFYIDQDSSRRVSVYCKKTESNEKYLTEFNYKKIRSLICQDARFTEGTKLASLFGGFKSLRVLEIYSCTKGGVSLPEEIGDLIHLKYLSLEKSKLNKVNTSFLSKLVNLQTLNLKDCNCELRLGDHIWSLRQLRNLYLDIVKPRANKSMFSRNAPTDKLNIGNLENLHSLVIKAGDWLNNGGLEKLSSLRKLRIEECLSSHSLRISNAVVKLTEVRSLALICKTSSTPLPSEGVPLISFEFSKHTFLSSLRYKGEIPGWPTSPISFPPYLCKLKMESSRIKEDPMPILEKLLPNLTLLHLGIDSFQGKEMVCSKGGFSCLETLKVYWTENLERWTIEEGALTNLVNLKIRGCIKLKRIPPGLQHLIKLQKLNVVDMPLLFQNRLKEAGKDWDKIKHIPAVGRLGWG